MSSFQMCFLLDGSQELAMVQPEMADRPSSLWGTVMRDSVIRLEEAPRTIDEQISWKAPCWF